MWNMKCVLVPAVTGATGIVTNALKEKSGSRTGK
jgi:hypothetical protein